MGIQAHRFWPILMISILLFTACGVVSTTGETGNSRGNSQVPQSSFQPGQAGLEISHIQKLALGIIKLEDTNFPVTAEQAKELAILWKVLRNLDADETSAAAEKDALAKQIQGTLTTEQLQAIENMNLTTTDMGEVASKLGIELDTGGGFGTLSEEQRATRQAAPDSGQFPPGGFRGGTFPGGGRGFGGEVNPQAIQTAMAEGGITRTGLGMPSALIDEIIKFLVERSKSG